MIKFEYNGKIYAPADLDKKLKKLGITKNDITIIDDIETKSEKVSKRIKDEQNQIENEVMYYYWDTLAKGWLIKRELIDSEDEHINRLHESRFEYIGKISKFDNYDEKIRLLWKQANKMEIHVQ